MIPQLPVIESPQIEKKKTPTPTPSPRSRKPLILGILGLGAIAAGTYGYHWWQS